MRNFIPGDILTIKIYQICIWYSWPTSKTSPGHFIMGPGDLGLVLENVKGGVKLLVGQNIGYVNTAAYGPDIIGVFQLH